MPPKITEADQRLMTAFQEAALRLDRILGSVSSPGDRRRALAQVEAVLSQLDQLSADYIREQVPLQYVKGSNEAIAQLRKLRGFTDTINETFTAIHQEALQQLADDAAQKFGSSLEGVRRSARSAITKSTKQAVMNKLIQNEIEGKSNPAVDTQKVLEDAGITAIQGSTRGWTLEDYASMLTHTVLADAHNTGAANRYVSNGVEYGEVVERADAPDKVCQWMRGKIVWLGDRRLLNPFHPRCMGESSRSSGTPRTPSNRPTIPGFRRR